MTDQDDTLLAAVLADPDADAPRRAFAAAKDAQGDPWGAFIRMQLDEAAEADPDSPRRTMLRVRAGEIERVHGASFAAAIAPWVHGYELHRGFVELVTLPARAFLDHAPELFARAPIQHLTLTSLSGAAAELFASPHLARIRSLDLGQCGLGDADAERLAGSPHLGALRWLSLALNRVDRDGVEALAASPHLPELRWAGFFGNPADPGEQYAHDQGFIVESWLPPLGEELEARHGRLRWLHHEARRTTDLPPSRYL